MTIYLGLSLSTPQTLPAAAPRATDELYCSPTGLLAYLEGFYGLGVPAVNRTALRGEQYRQLLTARIELAAAEGLAEPFYAASFTADAAATAGELLSRRDELIAAGYRLRHDAPAGCPPRIAELHALEQLLLDDRYDFDLLPGVADRLVSLLAALPEGRHPRLTVRTNEPRRLFEPGFRRLLDALAATGDTIEPLPAPEPLPVSNDLGVWQSLLRTAHLDEPAAATEKPVLKADGSLVLIRAHRETHIAAYLARLLRDNPDFRPGALLTVRNQTLDNAIIAEGLPSLGVPSTSLARPSLQVLKLITAFLWEPMEVDRVMEFVSLVTKPLHYRLANRIAVHLADTPGMFGPRWYGMINGFFREMEAERGWSTTRSAEVREQYNRLFERTRYNRNAAVPKYDLRLLLHNLRQWALDEYGESQKRAAQQQRPALENPGLLVLAAQAQRAVELLDVQPETEFSYLAVERLIRLVYEPAPTQFQHKEAGALDVIYTPASAVRVPGGPDLDRLLWWDFIEADPDYFFSRYYPNEISYLTDHGARPNGPDEQNELAAWTQLRPVLLPRRQLILCLPERVDGTVVEPHPLLGDLEAAFPDGALEAITVRIDAAGEADARVLDVATLPAFAPVPVRPLDRPVPHLRIPRAGAITEREVETPTALEDLLYYPHKWVFRHQLKLKGTPILSIAGENRLRGNLSHLFVEQLLNDLKQRDAAMRRADVNDWIDANWRRLLSHEGAVLLEYGQEPERVQFVRTMKYAAWSLVHHIQENGWSVRSSEEEVNGELEPMGGQAVKGRADLVLRRERNGREEIAVVDLKWRGKSVFRDLLINAKDVQLCLYAEFIRQAATAADAPVHTAYYVLRDARMIARNELAFANIETVPARDEADTVQRETLRKIRTTHNWRWEQFREGTVEIRCQETLGDLEDAYLDLDHDRLLEPADGDARFDDYRSLIGLVR